MKLEGVYKSFEEIDVLHNFNLTISDKEITCILGPSGCGKSTLLNVLAGIIKPDEGNIIDQKKKIGYVFQEDRLLPWKTVFENIKLVNKKASSNRIKALIDMVGLNQFENKYPHQLSGGMRQRCSIARAFNFESELLLMDEPFKSLDYDLRINMVKGLVEIWNKWKNTIVFVTHEIDEAILLGHKVVVLSQKPCTVEDVVEIDLPLNTRNLEIRELINVRTKLIKLLSNQENQVKCKSA
ncbi:ABC transporter ATP-binding protein [Alkaliphilus transvaalensis]|uniref:ABC transporter ATP-binding protein n=1 Tax=Alkaliphilus transvaalensis TaxID=114628 RepID=UPI000558799A|nr:ABC transporter ATP-binding protein [Alkaliphilus transvaalensis]